MSFKERHQFEKPGIAQYIKVHEYVLCDKNNYLIFNTSVMLPSNSLCFCRIITGRTSVELLSSVLQEINLVCSTEPIIISAQALYTLQKALL
jgi:hypothetical protein